MCNLLLLRAHVCLVLTAYKCDVMGRDCSECASLSSGEYAKYSCAFCGLTSRCVPRDTCLQNLVSAPNCPLPEIADITPLTGPWEGGTEITISGSNLGSDVDDVRSVKADGQTCRVIRDLYVVSQQ